MGFWNKRPPQDHAWLAEGETIAVGDVVAVPLTRNLDRSYFELLDTDVAEIHHWAPEELRFIKRTVGANDRIRSSHTRNLAVLVPVDSPDEVIGFVSVAKAHPDIPGEHFIGVHLLPDYRRQGIMSELLPLVFSRLTGDEFDDVVIATSKDNAAMNGLAKKLRLKHKNVEHTYPDGSTEKVKYYRVIASNFEPKGPNRC